MAGKRRTEPKKCEAATPAIRGDPHNKLPVIGSLEGLEKFAPDRFEDGHLDPRYSLDPGIRHFVLILRSQGIETCQSCQGGPGHTYLEPTVDFTGGKAEGPRAVAAALAHGLPVFELRRVWHIRDGEIDGPIWSMTFDVRADVFLERQDARTASWFERKKTGRNAC
jgi:hypothetical protein